MCRKLVRNLGVAVSFGMLACVLAGFDTVPKDQGIGGTGYMSRGDDNGISGTGYIGTITDFGSIIVNGREVELAETTQVRIDGVAASLADLKIGHVIAARSVLTASGETAARIDVVNTVVGPLDSYDRATGRGVILGQLVDFNSRLDRETLATGQFYAVSGLRAHNDVVIASFIAAVDESRFLVRGSQANIRAALASLKIANRTIPKSDALVLSGGFGKGGTVIRKLQPFSMMGLLGKQKSLVIESYVPPQGPQGSSIRVDAVKQNFALAKPFDASDFSGRDRIVLDAVNVAGHFVVKDVRPSAFSDSASANSKTSSAPIIGPTSTATATDSNALTGASEDTSEMSGESTTEDTGGSSGDDSETESGHGGGSSSEGGSHGEGGSGEGGSGDRGDD